MRETVAYCLNKCSDVTEVEDQLHLLGRRIGARVLDLFSYRHNLQNNVHIPKRETKCVPMLTFIGTYVWKSLFGKAADVLKGNTDAEYQLHDKLNCYHKFVSSNNVNCGSYAAGIVEGILVSAGFACRVSAHHANPDVYGGSQGLILLVKFEDSGIGNG